MKTTQTIDWKPFSKKHKAYIKKALCCKMSVAEGSIRSGKTIDNCIIAAAYLETCKDKIHLASGSTIGNAKLNIGACNGYGLENLFRGRCKWGKYKGNECLYLYTQTGEKVVIFAGGGKSDSYKKILGNSYGLWIATEINEHYDSDDSRESFIKVAFGRQVASYEPKILWDLNPCAPRNRIYEQYIDLYKSTYLGGYNYEHFTLADNYSISEQRRKEIEAQYDPNSVWYRRDILGQRTVAEGLVYPQYADMPEDYDLSEKECKMARLAAVTVGVDFGGTGSATTFVCTGFEAKLKRVIVLESQRVTEAIDPEQLNKMFEIFIEACYYKYGKPMNVYADSAEQVLIRGLRKTIVAKGLRAEIHNARKLPINDRIRLVNKLIAQERFFVSVNANTAKSALIQAIWNPKRNDERLDDGTSDIDTLDALEYSIEPFFGELSRV